MTTCDDGDMDHVDKEGRNKEPKARAKNDVGINHGELKINRKGGGSTSDSKADRISSHWLIGVCHK